MYFGTCGDLVASKSLGILTERSLLTSTHIARPTCLYLDDVSKNLADSGRHHTHTAKCGIFCQCVHEICQPSSGPWPSQEHVLDDTVWAVKDLPIPISFFPLLPHHFAHCTECSFPLSLATLFSLSQSRLTQSSGRFLSTIKAMDNR